jgi:hypothetical protein
MLGALKLARKLLPYARKLPPDVVEILVDVVRNVAGGESVEEQADRAARAAAALGIKTAFRRRMMAIPPSQ